MGRVSFAEDTKQDDGLEVEDDQTRSVFPYQETQDNKSWASALPVKQGLYDPENEKDACGVGFAAHIKGKPSHKIISDGQ